MIYMDAGASALKPKNVIDAELDFLENRYANAGRGVCARAANVDKMIADTRKEIASFIGAKSVNQIVFTSGTTDGMNRIARMIETSCCTAPGSCIAVSNLDHHSARMPFEVIARKNKCEVDICPLDDNFNLCQKNPAEVFVITAMSNVLGNAQDVKKIIADARALNPDVITIVDAAQYVAHLPIDVTDWDCDFMCFSGHKMGADTGIGIMYIKTPERWIADKFGGGMVQTIDGDRWTFELAPQCFEAGTLPLTQIAGLGAATEELKIMNYKLTGLVEKMRTALEKNPRIQFISPKDSHLITFTVKDMNHLDFGMMMGANDVCIRVGNMCATWIHKLLGVTGTCRISLGPWNTEEEVLQVVDIINKIVKV